MPAILTNYWAFEPAVVGALVVAACVHQVGYVRLRRATRGRGADELARLRFWRAVSFYIGLATVYIALESPIDYYSAELFWVHMVQHLLLITVAAPCFVLGAPWVPLLRGLPLDARRGLGQLGYASAVGGKLRAFGRAINRPVVAFVLFNGTYYAWHFPAAYDLTLENSTVHIMEHLMFLGLSMNVWFVICDSPPLRSPLNYVQRAVFIFFNAVAGWVLAVALGYASQPLYTYYAHLPVRVGGLSAYADQQYAAGAMWVPGMIAYTLAFVWCLWRWLEAEDDPDAALRKLVRDYGGRHGRAIGTSRAGDR